MRLLGLRNLAAAAAFAVACFLAATPEARADSVVGITGWAARVQSSGSNTLVTDTPVGDVDFELASGTGYGLGLVLFPEKRFSLEVAALVVEPDAALVADAGLRVRVGSLKMESLTAVAAVHLLPGRTVDVYAGVGAAYVRFDDIDSPVLDLLDLDAIDLEEAWAPVVAAGVTFELGEHVAIIADVKYLPVESAIERANERVTIDLNPLYVALGIQVRL